MIRIQIPATSANLGSGFDSLGVALTMYNQVWMEVSDETIISSRMIYRFQQIKITLYTGQPSICIKNVVKSCRD